MPELTDDVFADLLAQQVNTSLDLPLLGEESEQVAIRWCVGLVARFVPQSLRQLCLDASDGVSEQEFDRLQEVLVNVINTFVDLPGAPEAVEAVLIRTVVKACLEFARQGRALKV